MAGDGYTSLKIGLQKGLNSGGEGGTYEESTPGVITGYGAPTDAGSCAYGTIYIKLDATMGSTSHYRYETDDTWAPMSDD